MRQSLALLLCLAALVSVFAGQPAIDAIDLGGSLARQHINLPVKQGGEWVVQLPKGSHAASITDGPTDSDLFVCTLVKSAVYHVDLSTNTTRMIYQDNSTDPLPINGCTFDKRHNAVWASGSLTGIVRVIYLQPAGTSYSVKDVVDVTVVKSENCRPLQPCSFLLNEVAIGDSHVFVSDSFRPYLYALPRDVSAGGAVPVVKLPLGSKFHCIGPCMPPLSEKANGVAVVDNSTLLVSHWGNGNLYKVSLDGLTVTGVTELKLPTVNNGKVWADGLSMADSHTAYMGNNFGSSVLKLQFNADYTQASVTCVIQPKIYSVPTNVALKKDMVWAVNTYYLTCVPLLADCSQQTYEVVGVNTTLAC